MHYPISVEIFDATDYLDEISCSLLLIKWASPQNLLVEIMEAVFHYEKHLIPSDMVPISR